MADTSEASREALRAKLLELFAVTGGWIAAPQLRRVLGTVIKTAPEDAESAARHILSLNGGDRVHCNAFVDWLFPAVEGSAGSAGLPKKLQEQVDTFFQRLDGDGISQAFAKHAAGDAGELALDKIQEALQDIGIIRDPQELKEVAQTMDMDRSGGVTLQQFTDIAKAPTALEQWARTLPLAELLAACLPQRSGEALELVGSLTPGEIAGVELAFSSGFKRLLDDRAAQLRHALKVTKQRAEEHGQQAQGSKFTTFKMSCGTVENFHEGLQARVGAPSLEFEKAMRAEHCIKGGCDHEFVTSNYQVKTTARKEWEILMGQRECPPEDRGHGRTLRSLEELQELPVAKKAGLARVEVIAIVLYTGPLFQVYNTVLRRFPKDAYEVFEAAGNRFATTIHVLVSAIQKVAKVMPPPDGLTLYCGLGGLMELPEGFWAYDEYGRRGYTEWGFRSTTSNRAIAIQYSGAKEGRPLAMVLEIPVGSVDRGACIRDFSQYPQEVEYLWVPCSYLEPNGHMHFHVIPEGVVKVIPVRMNANLKARTIEGLLGQKKEMHLSSFSMLLDETRHELERLAEDHHGEERLKRDGDYAAAEKNDITRRILSMPALCNSVVEQCREVYTYQEGLADEAFASDESYRRLVGQMLDTKKFALAKLLWWLEDPSLKLSDMNLMGYSVVNARAGGLKDAFHNWVSFLSQQMKECEKGTEDHKALALKLCRIKGLLGSSVDEENERGERPFFLAVMANLDVEDLRLLVAAGADVDHMSKFKETALSRAVVSRNFAVVKELSEMGANMNKPINGIITPMMLAVANTDYDMVRHLAQLGGDVKKGVVFRQGPQEHAKSIKDDGKMLNLLKELEQTPPAAS